ncbi:hypothetical protein C0Z16_35800 [Paraburkholderia rhynchosiae]|uniref:Uncharacterized protein n=1 Tax=Paraburkholderia rhynchosiae TaxID=487049 RepID=A0ABX4UWU3_9BURK|nr:hypothetical protein C0Z16_35800 [Paraburkholderia rhynchosiae]
MTLPGRSLGGWRHVFRYSESLGRIHPLVAGVAVAMILASATGIRCGNDAPIPTKALNHVSGRRLHKTSSLG